MPSAAGVEVAALSPADIPAAVGVLARGMRDNPIHIAAFGQDTAPGAPHGAGARGGRSPHTAADLAVHTEDLDLRRLTGWLETDKPENVRLDERFGYEVVEHADVLGVPNWFMRRASR